MARGGGVRPGWLDMGGMDGSRYAFVHDEICSETRKKEKKKNVLLTLSSHPLQNVLYIARLRHIFVETRVDPPLQVGPGFLLWINVRTSPPRCILATGEEAHRNGVLGVCRLS